MEISIHASRGGSDGTKRYVTEVVVISIHASRGGSDMAYVKETFRAPDFNPRFPRGKRQRRITGYIYFLAISIHASRGGSDNRYKGSWCSV